MSAKLGETLLKDNLITPQQLKEALDYQRINGGRLASTLVKLGMLSDEEVTAVLSRQYGVPSVNLDLFEVDPAAVALVPQETAERYSVLPLSRVGATLTLAMVDPTNVFAIDDIKFMTGLSVEPVVVSETAFNSPSRNITAPRARWNWPRSWKTWSPRAPRCRTSAKSSTNSKSSPPKKRSTSKIWNG